MEFMKTKKNTMKGATVAFPQHSSVAGPSNSPTRRRLLSWVVTVLGVLACEAAFAEFEHAIAGDAPSIAPALVGSWSGAGQLFSIDDSRERATVTRYRGNLGRTEKEVASCVAIRESTYCTDAMDGFGGFRLYQLVVSPERTDVVLRYVDIPSVQSALDRKRLKDKSVTGTSVITDRANRVRELIESGELTFTKTAHVLFRVTPAWGMAEIDSWSNQTATACDRLAGMHNDPLGFRSSPDGTVSQGALGACDQAARTLPAHPRYRFLFGRALYDAGRKAEAVAHYRWAADLGYLNARLFIAELQIEGSDVAKDEAAAFATLRALAPVHADAAMIMGEYYRIGASSLLPKDMKTALMYYEHSHLLGSAAGTMRLADMYYDGQVVPRDLDKARALYWESRNKEFFAHAAARLGIIDVFYRKDAGGVKHLEDAVAGGDRWGYYYLGEVYRGRNDPKAIALFTRAFSEGIWGAAFNLGQLYHFGQGVPVDGVMAVKWYRAGIDKGDERAHVYLGDLFADGSIVTRDNSQAKVHYTRVAASDSEYRASAADWLQRYEAHLQVQAQREMEAARRAGEERQRAAAVQQQQHWEAEQAEAQLRAQSQQRAEAASDGTNFLIGVTAAAVGIALLSTLFDDDDDDLTESSSNDSDERDAETARRREAERLERQAEEQRREMQKHLDRQSCTSRGVRFSEYSGLCTN
jgi:TPR repeat protein